MLRTLQISNYALIEKLNLDFEPGFNIITGETGAGKSIMLGALSLILGERADTKSLRNPEQKAIIEARFTSPWNSALLQYCRENDIEWFDDECIVRREISPNSRSRAFINDSPVTLEHLQNVAKHLVDIHSQHQNQLLASPHFQLQIIDSIAGNSSLLNEYLLQYNSYRKALRKFHETRKAIQQAASDQEYTRFLLTQLEELAPQPGEQIQLERQRELLANVSEVKEHINNALMAISDGDSNALQLIGAATSHTEELAGVLTEAEQLPERLEPVRIELQDIAETLSSFDSALSADPDELEAVENRLNRIYELEHRHNVESTESLIEIKKKLSGQLSQIENSEETLQELEKEARGARALARNTAKEITRKRNDAAKLFAGKLLETASPLGMQNLRVEIAIEPAELSATGADTVEFKFAFNKNQPLMPVNAGASGGEISRLMLSIKTIIASYMQLPTIIFDEVDTGVSGKIADQMGRMMSEISNRIQVMAITHLPQVAAKGNAHYKVYKFDDEQATHTSVKKLLPDERIDEIAVMLSGSIVDETARAASISLLKQSVK